jgi:hypothetical protein
MKSTQLKWFFLIILLLPIISPAQQNSDVVNAEYAGKVEYTWAIIGTSNPPETGDSLTVEILNDSLTVMFLPHRYVDGSGPASIVGIGSKYLAVKEAYYVMVTATEETNSGSYDVKYTVGIKNDPSNTTYQILHKQNGKAAYMSILKMRDGFVREILVANLEKTN